jgi:DNA invertase Pin-like site-specific DNA recombinase
MNTKRQRDSEKLTILYERLSVDDEQRTGDSNSIINQKRILEEYAESNGFHNITHITDDGYSGTRFDRPGFVKAMELAEAGKVQNWLVKDLSRYGRDHLRVGLYTDVDVKNKLKKRMKYLQEQHQENHSINKNRQSD